jgi:hypothetical protein
VKEEDCIGGCDEEEKEESCLSSESRKRGFVKPPNFLKSQTFAVSSFEQPTKKVAIMS